MYEQRKSIARSPQQTLATTTRERPTVPLGDQNPEFDELFDATFRDLGEPNANAESGVAKPEPVRSEANDSAAEATHTTQRPIERQQASYRPIQAKALPRPGKVPRPAQATLLGIGHPVPMQPAPVRRIHSEPPPSECTRAYDQSQLSQLVRETDRSTSAAPPARDAFEPAEADASAQAQPYCPVQHAPAATLAAGMRGPMNTLPDQEELTTAYPQPQPQPQPQPKARDSIRDIYARPTMVDGEATRVCAFNPSSFASTEAEAPRDEALPPRDEMAEALPPRDERGYSAGQSEQTAARMGASRSRRARLVWVSVLVGCAVAAFVLWSRTDGFGARSVASSPWSRLHQIVVGQLTRLGPEANAMQPKPELIDLHVEVIPATAKLLLDGREASNPLKVSYPTDGLTHELRCSADGFKTRVQHVRFDRSVSVLIGLVPLPRASSGLREEGTPGAIQVGVRD